MSQNAHRLWQGRDLADNEIEVGEAGQGLRVLFLVADHTSLSQRTSSALNERGHEVSVAVVESGEEMEIAVAAHAPELIVCPLLEEVIPASIWSRHRCLVVHPGQPEDPDPSAIDWAQELGLGEWGLAVVEAGGEVDGEPVQALRSVPVREAANDGLYRHEARSAAVDALADAIVDVARFDATPARADPGVTVAFPPRAALDKVERMLDWSADSAASILGRLEQDARVGVLDVIGGVSFDLFGGHPEQLLRGEPGEWIAHRHSAICRATVDGAVWVTHLRRRPDGESSSPKLPAMLALAQAGVELDVPEIALPVHAPIPDGQTFRDVWYEEAAGVGYLHFDFSNGAMDTDSCRRLRAAYRDARERSQTRVIVLMGGDAFWSNGLHLNVVEVADDPGEASWRNLLAINDLVREIIETDSHLVVAALAGHAGAGGVPLALAADYVLAREGVVLNPYYQHMGGLYGSEYWTYLLPRRVGPDRTVELTTECQPVKAAQAVEMGLLDAAFGTDVASFRARAQELARRLARDPEMPSWLVHKRQARMRDESIKPLEAYRSEELARCHASFFGKDSAYHEARRRFVYKLRAPVPAPTATPPFKAFAVPREPPAPPSEMASAPPVTWTASAMSGGLREPRLEVPAT